MAAPLESRRDHVTVSPSKPTQAIQLVQGSYYILAGVVTALFIETIQGPADRPRPGPDLWLVRVIGLAVAGFGVALVLSGRREGRGFVPAWAGMFVAFLLLTQASVGMAFGFLPLTFLADAALELLFFVWWVVAMFGRVEREIDESTPLPS
jgi:hypothetical protein